MQGRLLLHPVSNALNKIILASLTPLPRFKWTWLDVTVAAKPQNWSDKMVGPRLFGYNQLQLQQQHQQQQQCQSSTTQWPRLKKMYLILVLSTVCIFVFQYHISKSQLDDSSAPDTEISQSLRVLPGGVFARHQEPMRELLLADSGQQSAVTAQDEVPLPPPPPIYVITPTFRRGEQLAELTRLGYTLKHVPNLFWLVIEDSAELTPAVSKLLTRIGVPFEHLIGKYKLVQFGISWQLPNAISCLFQLQCQQNSVRIK